MNKIFTFFLTLLLAQTASAQFVSTGTPTGQGNCYTVYADDDIVLVSMNDAWNQRLFRSTDGGQTFEGTYPSQDAFDTRVILRINNTIIIGVNNAEKVYRSFDLGQTWETSNTGMPALYSPVTGAVVGSRVFIGGTTFFRYSDNEGQTWQTAEMDGATTAINKINDELWVSVAGTTYITSDTGATWQTLPTNPASSPTSFAKTQNAILASTEYSGGTAVRRSTDNGLTWNNAGSLSIVRRMLQIDDVIYSTSFNGLRRSTDDGLTWMPVENFEYDVVSGYHGRMWHHNDYLWIGTSTGPVRIDLTDDSAYQPALPYTSLSFITPAGNNLFAATTTHVYRSQNNGVSWNIINENITANSFFVEHMIVINGELYIIIDQSSTYTLYKSSDGGNTFSVVAVDTDSGNLTSYFSYNPQFIATRQNSQPRIRKSNDDGASWTTTTILNHNGNTTTESARVNSLHKAGDYLIAHVSKGYMLSTDNGDNWTWNHNTLSPASVGGWNGRLIRSFYDNHHFATNPTYRVDIMESTDDGATWAYMETGLPPVGNPTTYGSIYTLGNRIYLQITDANTENAFRFYFLEENSNSWTLDAQMDGLPSVATTLVQQGETIYAAIPGGGLWKVSVATVGFEPIEIQNISINVYPVPARHQITVDLSTSRFVVGSHLQITDINGKIVFAKNISSPIEQINVEHFSRGIYNLTVANEKTRATKKIIIE